MPTTAFQQLSDEYLVVNFQKDRNVSLFDLLYRRYSQRVYCYCYKIIGNPEDAQDVCSEVFVKVFEKLDTLRDAVTFQAWLFRIARNTSINMCLERQNKFYIPIEDAYDLADEVIDLAEHEEKVDKIVKMGTAIKALPDETQALLIAKYYHGESIETLMQRYNLSESAVKMRLARARMKANRVFARA